MGEGEGEREGVGEGEGEGEGVGEGEEVGERFSFSVIGSVGVGVDVSYRFVCRSSPTLCVILEM